MKEYKIPEETKDLFKEYQVCIECRDQCIKSFFKAKRAIMYGKQARDCVKKAWSQVYDIYPDLLDKSISYSHDGEFIFIKEKEEDVQ